VLKKTTMLTLLICCFLVGSSCQDSLADHVFVLWYDQPASQWTEALPLGNGRLGTMFFGDPGKEHLQFNEDTLWTGEPHEYHNEGAANALPQIRRLLSEGHQKEAEDLALQEFMSIPLRQKAYQPFGDLYIEFPGHEKATDYRRQLDIEAGVGRVHYWVDGLKYKREMFVSAVDQALIIRLSADLGKSLNFTVSVDSPHPLAKISIVDEQMLKLNGRVQNGALEFEAHVMVRQEGGKSISDTKSIHVSDANRATLILVAATSFKDFQDVSADPALRCLGYLDPLRDKPYVKMAALHEQDHRSLFNRVQLNLGTKEFRSEPTDERLAKFNAREDPQLAALFFQYGRYLMITSSRPGSQPANLQGIWNDQLEPPWESKWTTNINTEMNYWPVETTNLSECHEPLFALLEDLVISGSKTAKAHYGARGWVLHHNTDIWRGTAPINASNHGIWATGGAWLCQHLMEHYRFTGDNDFLAQRAYPIMKAAAEFFLDYLAEDPKTGRFISSPSNSPEIGGLVAGPTMDHQIIRSLFADCISAGEILGIDEDFRNILIEKRKQIAPNKIGRHGQLQEWLEDKDDPQNQHRHVSHLWGLHPGSEINWKETPELYEAAKQSLTFRGDGGTGWSMAWKINFWARFLDGNHAYRLLKNQLTLVPSTETNTRKGGTYPNLFDAHPPFQIDGNFGATAGIAEMLLQSHLGELHLLPALPDAWPEGYIRGLRARGGFEVSISWSDKTAYKVVIKSLSGSECRIRTRIPEYVSCEGNRIDTQNPEPDVVQFSTEAGKVYRLRF